MVGKNSVTSKNTLRIETRKWRHRQLAQVSKGKRADEECREHLNLARAEGGPLQCKIKGQTNKCGSFQC